MFMAENYYGSVSSNSTKALITSQRHYSWPDSGSAAWEQKSGEGALKAPSPLCPSQHKR